MSQSTLILLSLLALPLWLPLLFLVAYLVVVLCTVCVDGLVYFTQTTLRLNFAPGRLTRVALIPVALVLFPLAMTAELAVLFASRSVIGFGGAVAWVWGVARRLPVWFTVPLAVVWLAVPVSLVVEHGSLEFDEGGILPTWIWLAGLWIIAPPLGVTMVEAVRQMFPRGQQMVSAFGRGSHGIFESFVGLRYLKAKKDQSFISAITLISVAGVMVGVCSLIVVLSVMAGFEDDLKQKILGTNSHVIVLRYGSNGVAEWQALRQEILDFDGVAAATPFVYREAMLTTEQSASGVVLKGIDPASVGTVTDLVNGMKVGVGGVLDTPEERQEAVDALTQSEGPAGILLGEELAGSMQVIVGDKVTVVSPLGEIGPMGTRIPKFKQFRVVGIFHTGMFEYDSKFSYVSLESAQDFFGMGPTVTGIEVKVDDIYAAREIGNGIEARLGYPYWSRDWMEMNKNLFSALRLEKIVMGIILTMIIGVAALNIISTLIMLVIEKGKEISILKAMGASEMQIMKVFMIEGIVIGFTGTTLGSVMGLGLCLLLKEFDLIRLDPDVYYLESLPVQLSATMFVVVALVAMTISFVATLYPSWRASRLDPVEGLRYE